MSDWKEAGVRGGSGGVGCIRFNNGLTLTYEQARAFLATFDLPWEDDNGQHTTYEGRRVLLDIVAVFDLLVPQQDYDAVCQHLVTHPEAFAAFRTARALGAPDQTEADKKALRGMLYPELKT
jgi:hypothetical protein